MVYPRAHRPCHFDQWYRDVVGLTSAPLALSSPSRTTPPHLAAGQLLPNRPAILPRRGHHTTIHRRVHAWFVSKQRDDPLRSYDDCWCYVNPLGWNDFACHVPSSRTSISTASLPATSPVWRGYRLEGFIAERVQGESPTTTTRRSTWSIRPLHPQLLAVTATVARHDAHSRCAHRPASSGDQRQRLPGRRHAQPRDFAPLQQPIAFPPGRNGGGVRTVQCSWSPTRARRR